MTTIKLWDVVCTCGHQSSAKRTQAEADKLADVHRFDHGGQTVTVREITVNVDDLGRVVPPVQVTP